MFVVKEISLEDDLESIVGKINSASWDAANELSDYDAASLSLYLQRQDTVFVVCYGQDAQQTLLGMASARIEIKPYQQSYWLYVDEVDVCADQRRQGVGKSIMQKLMDIARRNKCDELWLGTEALNVAANALYTSLTPDGIEQVIGYTYEFD